MANRESQDYEKVFNACVAAGKVVECLMLLKHMNKDGVARTMDHYNRVIRLAVKIGYWSSVLDALSMLEKKDEELVKSGGDMINKMIFWGLRACEKLGKGNRANTLLSWGLGIEPPLEIGPAVLFAMRANFRAGLMEAAATYACFILDLSPPPFVVNGLPSLKALSPPPAMDLVGANMAISALAKTNQTAQALQALDRMVERGLRPDVVSYGSAIEGLAVVGDWQAALKLVNRMRREGLAPNVIVMNMVLNACCRAGALNPALSLYERMKEQSGASLEPHRIHPFLTAATRLGDESVVLRLIEDIEGQEGMVGVACYEASVCNLAKLGKHELAKRLVLAMQSKGVAPTMLVWSALIMAADRAGEWADLLDYMGGMMRAGYVPDATRYSMGLKACERLGRWQAGMDLVRHMLMKGLEVNSGIWRRLLVLLGREARPDEALMMLDLMQERRKGR